MLESVLVTGSVLFLALMVYIGSKKGLIKIIYSLAALIAAMILSQCLSIPVTNFIEKNTKLYDVVKEQMDIYVDENLRENFENSTEQVRENILDSLKLPPSVTNKIDDDYVQPETGFNIDEFCNYVSEGLTSICIRAITTIILFVLIALILRVGAAVLNGFAGLPVIKQINKFTGAVAGFAEGVIILWILCIVLMAITGTPAGNMIMNAVDNNVFLSFIYDSNVFAKLLGSLIA